MLTERGKVKDGGIIFSEPLSFPEGTEVIVRIEPVDATDEPTQAGDEGFASLPFFGMWAERAEMSDSAAWVREERENWQRRAQRRD